MTSKEDSPLPTPRSKFVRVGQIAGAFGLKGQLKIQPLTDFASERFRKGLRLRMGEEFLEIESVSTHKGRPLVKFKGIDSIEAVEAIQFRYLEAVEQPRTAKNEFLVADLVGLTVRTVEGETLGTIRQVLPNPAHEILVVGEIMIPLVEHFVTNVDLTSMVVTVRLIPGMRPGEL